MLRFTRVVALPDLKIAIFPAESILSYGWVAGYVLKRRGDKRRFTQNRKETQRRKEEFGCLCVLCAICVFA